MAAEDAKRRGRPGGRRYCSGSRRFVLLTVAVYILSIGSLLAAPKTLEEYRQIYERKKAAIEAARSEAAENSLSVYGRNLLAAKEYYRKSGDLEGITGAKEEIERFGGEKTVPETSDLKTPALVLQARMAHAKRIAAAQEAHDKRTVSLVRQYMRALDDLKKELVRSEKLDAARNVAAEMSKLEVVLAHAQSGVDETGGDAGRDANKHATIPDSLGKDVILHYSFDGEAGMRIEDVGGGGRHGKVLGRPKTVDGRIGNALEFDGAGTHILVGRDRSFHSRNHTIAAWVKSKNASRWQGIAGCWLKPGAKAGYGLVMTGARRYALAEADGKGWSYAMGDVVLGGDAQWHHVVGVKRGGTAVLYVDGVKQKGTAGREPVFGKDSVFLVGYSGHSDQYFDGAIDELLVLDRALSAAEVGLLYRLQRQLGDANRSR